MTEIMLDDVLKEKLGELREPIKLLNAAGNVVALVTPVVKRHAESPYSDEEVEDILRNTTKWYTTDEVLAHLQSL